MHIAPVCCQQNNLHRSTFALASHDQVRIGSESFVQRIVIASHGDENHLLGHVEAHTFPLALLDIPHHSHTSRPKTRRESINMPITTPVSLFLTVLSCNS